MKKNTPIQFGIRTIRTDEFATIENVHIEDKKVRLEHNFVFSLSKDTKEVTVSFNICFLSEDDPFIVLRVTCSFEVKTDNLLIPSDGGSKKIEIPKDFIIHLAFLTTGTARGVLHSKLEQTPFNKYLLPIIDVTKAFKGDATFDLAPT
jgi:hypothetical protein